eukprot:318375-Prorocentrum_minimum.AAC.1
MQEVVAASLEPTRTLSRMQTVPLVRSVQMQKDRGLSCEAGPIDQSRQLSHSHGTRFTISVMNESYSTNSKAFGEWCA